MSHLRDGREQRERVTMAALRKILEMFHHNSASKQSEGEQVIQLSERDSMLFVNSLRYPPKPNKFLQDAMREFYHKV
jgi:uncharacterized protein (DUF1778 family)